ncbi:MAG: hypothetical protein Q8P71_00240 [bacterium]|nr:hypothetical protein [bacterium]
MNTKQKTLLVITGGSAVMLGILVFLIIPFAGHVSANSAKLEELKGQIAQMAADEKSIQYFQNIIAGKSKDMGRISEIFIDRTSPIAFIEFLEDLGGDTLEVVPGVVEKEDNLPWDFLEFRITMHGSYKDLFLFLEGLEHSPYLVEVKTMSLAQELDGNLRLSLVIQVFVSTP